MSEKKTPDPFFRLRHGLPAARPGFHHGLLASSRSTATPGPVVLPRGVDQLGGRLGRRQRGGAIGDQPAGEPTVRSRTVILYGATEIRCSESSDETSSFLNPAAPPV